MVLSHPALAEESRNRCHHPATVADWEKLLSTNPRESVVTRLLLRCVPAGKIRSNIPGMKAPGQDEIPCSVPSAALKETGTEHSGSIRESQ